jgi:ABC-type transport system involved in multi-copper enzyme maturation permease subunit
MLRSMFHIESVKLYRRKTFWLELVVVAGITVLLFGLIFFLQYLEEIPKAERALITSLLTLPNGVKVSLALSSNQMLGGLLMIVLVSMAVAQEYAWQSYTLPVRAGIPRPLILLSKFLTLLGAALLLAFTALGIGVIMSALVTLAAEGQIDLSRINVADLLLSTLITAYSLLPYMALTFMIAVLSRSLAASLSIAAAYIFLVEGLAPALLTLFGGVLAQISLIMPGQLATALLTATGQTASMQIGSDAPPPAFVGVDAPVAVIGIALYTLVFLGIAIVRFQKQDLAG